MATVSLARQHGSCFAHENCDLNSCHAPQLAIFKFRAKLRVQAIATLRLGGTVANALISCNFAE